VQAIRDSDQDDRVKKKGRVSIGRKKVPYAPGAVSVFAEEDQQAGAHRHTHWHNYDLADVCRWVQALDRLHALIAPRFARAEPCRRVEVREVEPGLLKEQDWQRLALSEGTKGPRL
jgi:hypothetical protein